MIIRELRLQRGWTQDQLAQLSGLNVRTIQRIEKSQGISIESLNSLSAVFEIPVNELKRELDMRQSTNDDKPTPQTENQEDTLKKVRDLKEFYQHLVTFICIGGIMLNIDLLTSPDQLWSKWPVFGWGIGVLVHALYVLGSDDFFGEPLGEKRSRETTKWKYKALNIGA